MYLLLGIGVIVIAFIVVKITTNKAVDPDSQLGILEHPSTFKKQGVEMVEKPKAKDNDAEDSITFFK